MASNYISLYNINSRCESAFFLNEGSVYFYASNDDKYAINGKNLVVGATEIIMNRMLDTPTNRIETAITPKTSAIKKMSIEKFLEGMKVYSFSLNVSIVLAKHVNLTNQIIKTNLSNLTADETKTRELSIEYYSIIARVREDYEKRKLPWLKPLIMDYETTLTYKRGEAFFKSSEPVQIATSSSISDKDIEYKRGTIICEENTIGKELYILKTGAIDVTIQGNKVASIDSPGTVIGEMALLLGEKRTATLIAKNNVIITRIKKEDLKEVVEKQSNFLIGISQSLAKRHYYNIIKINSINKAIIDKHVDEEITGEKKMPQSLKVQSDLRKLKIAIEDLARSKDAPFLDDLIATF